MSKKKTVVSFTILILVLAGIGVGAWWYLAKYTQGPSYESFTKWGKKSETKEEEQASTEKTSGVKYTNSQFGFELTFPDAWKDYGVMEVIFEGETKTVYFGLPKKTSTDIFSQSFLDYYDSPFAISIYTKTQWATAQSQEFAPRKITENDSYVFTYSRGNGVLDIAGMNQEQAYNDIETIIQTFEFIK